jgi:hypothetical protein
VTSSEDFQASVTDGDTDDSVIPDYYVTENADNEPTRRVNPLVVLPLLVGVLILAFDGYLLMRMSVFFFQKNFQAAVSLALVFASVIVSLALVIYALGVARVERLGQRVASPFATWVGVPLLIGLVALGATIGGMELNRAASERQTPTPCIQVYAAAQGIAKENPIFRMSPTDRDEIRCGVNAAIGR